MARRERLGSRGQAQQNLKILQQDKRAVNVLMPTQYAPDVDELHNQNEVLLAQQAQIERIQKRNAATYVPQHVLYPLQTVAGSVFLRD